jgi:hypothetical protein
MLLVEWQAWWEHMPAIAAAEWLDALRLQQAADPNSWKMDRDAVLQDKQTMAALASARRPTEDAFDAADPWGLRRGVRRVFAWLKSEFGGQVGSG